MAPKCYHGKVLHVDLTNGKTWVENPPEEFYRKYGGGSAMGVYYLLKESPSESGPVLAGERAHHVPGRPNRSAYLRPIAHGGHCQVTVDRHHRRQPMRRLLPGSDEIFRL